MYRTYTYIAGDWERDQNVITKIQDLNKSKFWGLTFKDAHDITQARDTSLNCSIKRSLKIRLDASKTFVLVVGEKTKELTAGSCHWCDSYNSWNKYCAKGYSVDYRSFIEYECEVAKRDINKIVVIYNSFSVNRDKCPEELRYIGKHIPAFIVEYGQRYWNIAQIESAIMY